MRIPKSLMIGSGIVIFLILLLIISPVLMGFYWRVALLLLYPHKPLQANIEIIVPENEKPDHWLLSPKGDKIAYTTFIETKANFLLFPATQQKYKLGNCNIYTWVDNSTLFCLTKSSIVIVNDADSIDTFSLKRIPAREVDIESLFQEIDVVYRFEDSRLNNMLWFRDISKPFNPNKNYLVNNIQDLDTLSEKYEVRIIQNPGPVGYLVEKAFSPDGLYYYSLQRTVDDKRALEIYDVNDNSKLSEFVSNDLESIILGGWASDSSGVFFQVDSFSRLWRDETNLNKILKLKVRE